ncbi:MAG: hypothetical protein LBT52_06735, partial [Clostridiales Family XIII bacterium]|nr:hypothetical protein [Clostridiales Family XIII bacterium]
AEREAAIIETIGEIEVTGTEGSSLHEGSEVVIKGTGFYGDVSGIDIEIHSTPTVLGTVASDADGNFEATVLIPEGIEEGAHNIVALYKGTELVRAPIEVNPAPADSFLKAFSVGLTGDNEELTPGILIFIALVAIGLITLLVGNVRRRRKASAVAASGFETPSGFESPSGFETPGAIEAPNGFETPSGFGAPSGFETPGTIEAPNGFETPSGFGAQSQPVHPGNASVVGK